MSHRVIAGTAKGRILKQVSGTRPIMDRVKEALFNILGTSIIDGRILDLFAGTGAVGIEALSRGAEWATFCDIERIAVRTIHDNLAVTGLAEQAEVFRTDAFAYLQRKEVLPYTLVYIAPPQYEGIWKRALLAIDSTPRILEPDAMVIVQIDPKEQEPVSLQRLRAFDERTYGNTLLWFFEYDMELSGGVD
ncbi:MAG TPA: 16S rRNA (guanine(966)-N(2))-methyltransferase RsmD [Aggregatilineales bacterium]|nr:16S rRNA (guanine(966)-N(2))-methyltransferase RsmD [Aggregatilineales bacterium]